LKAPWAVFFDSLSIPWEYEPQAYWVGFEPYNYLPDFWLPLTQTWVEVRKTATALDWNIPAWGETQEAERDIKERLLAACRDCGLPDDGANRTTNDALAEGRATLKEKLQ